MARKPKITEQSLAKLGADRLAALLVTEAARNRQLKQALELALEAEKGPDNVAATIRRRLTTIRQATSALSVDRAREVVAELNRLKATLLTDVAAAIPDEALDLLWLMVDLHPGLIERCFQRAHQLPDFFRAVCQDLGPLASKSTRPKSSLANQVLVRVLDNPYGLLDGLITIMAESLGKEGLAVLKTLLLDERQIRITANTGREEQAGRYDHRLSTTGIALRDIADCQGDVDAYVEACAARDPSNPAFAAEIAIRLVAAGRAEEALEVLDRATPSEHNRYFKELEWTDARIAALDALGRAHEAHALRWHAFEKFLSRRHLRAYLNQLPDFDDVEAEDRALAWVGQHPSFHSALMFLIGWPAHPRAAALVESRATEIDGDRYEILNPAAAALEGKFALAASLLRRALVTFTLQSVRSSRYRHAARHVLELESLLPSINDFGRHETHSVFMDRLKRDHARKIGFWSALDEARGRCAAGLQAPTRERVVIG